jgi:hypothetical protein
MSTLQLPQLTLVCISIAVCINDSVLLPKTSLHNELQNHACMSNAAVVFLYLLALYWLL